MGKATLTDAQRDEIIRLKTTDATLTDQHLADQFGVNKSTVTRVLAKHKSSLNATAAGGVRLNEGGVGGDVESTATPGIAGVAWNRIHPSPLNPRKTFNPAKLGELAASIRAKGMLQNIVVRPHPDKPSHFEIAAGERRWRAIGLLIEQDQNAFAADTPLPCRIENLDDVGLLEIAMAENVDRDDVPPLEEAEGYKHLAALMIAGGQAANRKAACEQIGQRLGVTGRHVELRIALVEKLCPAAQAALTQGDITLAQARAMTTGVDAVTKEVAALQEEAIEGVKDGWAATAADVKEHMAAERPPVSWALFDVALYDGAIVPDPDGADDDKTSGWFADIGQAHKLQRAAIKALPDKFRAEGRAFVQTVDDAKGEYFQRHRYGEAAKGKPGGVVIHVKKDLSVTLHERLTLPQEDKPKTAAKDAPKDAANPAAKPRKSALEAVTKAHAFHARRRKAQVVQDAVARDFAQALRLTCLALAGCMDAVGIHAPRLDPDVLTIGPATAAVLAPYDKDLGGGVGAWADGEKVWDFLQGIDGEALENLFAAMVARRVFNRNYYQGELGDDAMFLEIAKTLRLPGREENLDLTIFNGHAAEDLAGLQNSALEAIAYDALAAPGKTAAATREAIGNTPCDAYVLPTLRFGAHADIAKALADADKAFLAAQKFQAKTKDKAKAAE